MPKIKVAKKSPSLDMTPMVDLAFLLVTFFMLTTKFRPDEPVIVDQPSSVSEITLPDKGVIMITVDKDNRVFFNVEGQQVRKDILERVASYYNLTYDENQLKRFSVLSAIGMPVKELGQYLKVDADQRRAMNDATTGIPIDTVNNELAIWVNSARKAAPRFSIAIKGDKQASIPTIKRIISILQDNKANRFALVTNLEGAEEAKTN
jgi:biopolymer transport protein ExbD